MSGRLSLGVAIAVAIGVGSCTPVTERTRSANPNSAEATMTPTTLLPQTIPPTRVTPTDVATTTLPNPGGTCIPSQLVVGAARDGFTFAALGTRHAYLRQGLHNVGAACVLAVPAVIGVATANGPIIPIGVNNTGNEVCAKNACHYETPASYEIGPGKSLELDFSLWWWDQNGAELFSAPPCLTAVKDVTRVDFPVASGAIAIDLEASIHEAGSSIPWQQVCSSPESVNFSITLR